MTLRRPATSLLTALALCLIVSCGDENDGSENPASGAQNLDPVCTTPTAVACEDQAILSLDYKSNVATGSIDSHQEGDSWHSSIDASAGGAFSNMTDSYVYARFTDSGLQKVALTDEQALTSMDWDLAFRRFVIRVNSGNSGPSCVTGARMADGTDFDGLTLDAVPASANYREDAYFGPSCDLIPDGNGLGTPATVLSGFWTYSQCVKMSGNVYVLQLADGRLAKLTVTHYYSDAAQQQCQDGANSTKAGSASIQMLWAYLN